MILQQNRDQKGFITMIVLLLILVLGAIALVFWRVISAG
jgi:Tfp pilus assembly protein PilX